ncbi:MAG: ABC-type phosphate transport system substrate-binding protein [Planctomycetota bacterium]|jgi:ABC-type phosphate transport system substrate-binding protein
MLRMRRSHDGLLVGGLSCGIGAAGSAIAVAGARGLSNSGAQIQSGSTEHGWHETSEMIGEKQQTKTWLSAVLLWLVATTQLTQFAVSQSGNLCSWSPNGLMLLFVGRDGDRHFVARYDVATQSATRVFLAKHGERIDTVQWCTNSKTFVAVTALGISRRSRPVQATIHLLSHPAGTIINSFSPPLGQRKLWGSPIYQPGRILIEASGMVELNPNTGKMHALQRPQGEARAMLGTFGDGIGYLSVKPAATGGWSLGTLNAEDLSRRVYCDSRLIPQAKVQLIPAFAPGGERIALPAVLGTKRSILVFENNQLLDTRELGPETDLTIFDVQWSPDSKTIYVLGRRPLVQQNKTQHVLLETEVHGNSLRETKLFTAGWRLGFPAPRSLSISSNARNAAVVDGLYGDATSSLYLIDLTRPERTVTKARPLKRTHLVLCGSGSMTELGRHWLQTYQGTRKRYAEVLSVGSSDGFSQLLQGKADIALMVRPPTAKERATAKAIGVEVYSAVARRQALAVCVHPDNPLATIERAQLRRLFTVLDKHRWSQFDAQLPATAKPTGQPQNDQDQIAMAMFLPGSRHYMPFRQTVLNGRLTTHQPTTRETAQDLGKFVVEHRNAIACLPMLQAIDLGSAVRMVPIKTTTAHAVALTAQTIADGSYPLLETWFVAYNKNAGSRVRDFYVWLASDAGQDATADFELAKAK